MYWKYQYATFIIEYWNYIYLQRNMSEELGTVVIVSPTQF